MLEYLEFPELVKLLDAAKRDHVGIRSGSPKRSVRLEALIGLMAFCGLRLNEAISLPLASVIRQEIVLKVIYLPGEITKYKKPREVYLPEPMHEIMTRWLFIREKMKTESPLLFPSFTGEKLDVTTVQKAIGKCSMRVLGRKVHPHALRHTFGTLLARTAPIRVVQEAMGHSKLSSTMIYTHVTRPEIQKAVGVAFDTPPIVERTPEPAIQDAFDKAFEKPA